MFFAGFMVGAVLIYFLLEVVKPVFKEQWQARQRRKAGMKFIEEWEREFGPVDEELVQEMEQYFK